MSSTRTPSLSSPRRLVSGMLRPWVIVGPPSSIMSCCGLQNRSRHSSPPRRSVRSRYGSAPPLGARCRLSPAISQVQASGSIECSGSRSVHGPLSANGSALSGRPADGRLHRGDSCRPAPAACCAAHMSLRRSKAAARIAVSQYSRLAQVSACCHSLAQYAKGPSSSAPSASTWSSQI
jgi:hypothetical protein